ncbi:APH(3') family aminoglycoside O-phosphotransferase [Quadrisphaera oryzae]|uniref:APH(3') family aminoglycoside O-phosphotransferase n=1 Tax=Quadrisphaera TaxID=317661 RepID=UPI0016485BFA|nr:aminoglycoside 3'-phosphotransferase [Quadrisphaera sp. RL12-1S]
MGEWEPVTAGKSGARVWRGRGVHRKQDAPERLAAESARLTWLGAQGLPCPQVVSLGESGLVTTTVPGRPATHLDPAARPRATASLAEVLRALHALPVTSCPFDARLRTTTTAARRRAADGLVDLADLDPEHRGWSAAQLLTALDASLPSQEELAVCHGDPGLPNILFDDTGEVTGLLDVERLGVADRCRDLAIAHRSTRDRLGGAAAEELLAHCGASARDRGLLPFYRLLDEFF